MDGEGPRIAINGFGRIGRIVTRILLAGDAPVDLVGINDLTDKKTLAHLFRYDSVHGRFAGHVEQTDDGLVLDGDRLQVFAEPDPSRASGRTCSRTWSSRRPAASAPGTGCSSTWTAAPPASC